MGEEREMSDGKRKIMVVDDEPSIVKMVSKRLELKGFEVVVATDGPQALELAKREHPDFIILDLMLPTLDGFQVCQQLKSQQQSKDVPVVIMFSGKGQPEDAERCRQAGAYGYVSKTQGTAALLAQIETVLQRPSACIVLP